MRVYRCSDSIESIFTAIYNTYLDKCDPSETKLDLTGENFLFCEEVEVVPDTEKTKKVMRTLEREFGQEDTYKLCCALASFESSRADDVYHTIRWGLKTKPGKGHLLDHLADEYVLRTFKMSQNVSREIHHLLGFVRFEEMESRILYSEIGPKNNILSFLMPHFADRLPMEHFVIHDEKRNLFGVHPAGKQWFFVSGEEDDRLHSRLKASSEEEQYEALFRTFVKTIAIQSRENLKLQQNMLPLRFREYMVEWK